MTPPVQFGFDDLGAAFVGNAWKELLPQHCSSVNGSVSWIDWITTSGDDSSTIDQANHKSKSKKGDKSSRSLASFFVPPCSKL
jgi:hypothetical protein